MSKQLRKRSSSSIFEDNLNKKRKGITDQLIVINKKIKTLDDLIELGLSYDPTKKYNINLKKLNKIVPVLTKLKNVIGMEEVKKSIVGQIIFFLQDFQDKNQDMLHTVIQGPPGVGKTMLGHIIGQIYWELDIIQSDILDNLSDDDDVDDVDDDDVDDDVDDVDDDDADN
jgi:ATP-dependent Lon protease